MSTPTPRRALPPASYSRARSGFRTEVLARLETLCPSSRGHRRAQRKALALLLAVAGCYAVQIAGGLSGVWLALAVALAQPLYLITAMGIAHDASHGGLSKRRWPNALGTYIFDVLGVNGYIWHFDHVTAHHNTPNVSRYDANLYGWGPVRMDPRSPLKPFHRYQHIYAPAIYALASLFKVYAGDFLAFTRTRVEAYLPLQHRAFEFVRLIGFKLWAVGFALVLPMMVNGEWVSVLTGYLGGHVAAGLLMGAVFQPTHTNELVRWPASDARGEIASGFEEHVLATSADFCVDSRFVTWLAGGLNIHAVHHLFPRLPHQQLPEAAAALAEVAPRHGLTYRTFPSWGAAIASHLRALRVLGQTPPETVDEHGDVFGVTTTVPHQTHHRVVATPGKHEGTAWPRLCSDEGLPLS